MEQQELIQLQEQVRLKKQIELIEENAKKFLSKEALNRFGNLKLAFPDKSLRVCGLIIFFPLDWFSIKFVSKLNCSNSHALECGNYLV